MASPLLAVLFRNCKHDSNPTSSPNKVRYALQCDNFAVQIARTPIQMPMPGHSPELMDFGIFRPSISISGMVNSKGGSTNIGQKGFEFMDYFDYTRRRDRETPSYTNRYYFPYKNQLEENAYKWKTSSGAELELELVDANQPQLLRFSESTEKGNTDLDNPSNETLLADTTTITLTAHTWNNRTVAVDDYLVIEGENPAYPGNDDMLLWEIVKVTNIGSAPIYTVERGVLGSTKLTHVDERNVYFYEEPTGGGVYSVSIQQARFQVDAAKEDRWSFQIQFICKARDDIDF